MSPPRATRRHAISAVMAVCVLVLGGLAWATTAAIELNRVRAAENWKQSYDDLRALALSRLDAFVAPVLYRETARPYNHFRRYYKPTAALTARQRTPVEEPVLLESPLKSAAQPDWVLLYFQAKETNNEPIWSSPQLEDEGQFALLAGVPAAEDPLQSASPEYWLAALRDRYSPSHLQDELENALATRLESRRDMSQSQTGEVPAERRAVRPPREPIAAERLSRSAAEFVRRGGRLLELELESNVELCVPEQVARENLEFGAEYVAPDRHSSECVPVWLTSMAPLWLDIVPGREPQLAFLRSVVVEGQAYCTLQGVLLDWRRLRDALENEVRDLFPAARVLPVSTANSMTAAMAHTLMQTIPVRVEPGDPANLPIAPGPGGLKVGLAVAWGATILALTAIAYGTMKYVAMIERRMRFVAAVTHELRTPLTSFQLYTDLLADLPPEDRGQRRQFIETLRKESKRLARLVENVLDYSRITDSGQPLRLREARPQEVLDAVRSAMAEQCSAAGKDLVIENQCPPDLRIETDSDFVVRILGNLVENACKYSAGAADPRIWLAAVKTADHAVAFEVDDAGPGVAPRDRRHVFEPFRRGRASADTGTAAMGLGLGLALSRYWAACLGGRLILQRSPRNGLQYSCFTLALPVLVAENKRAVV